jgi:hypothetical protein
MNSLKMFFNTRIEATAYEPKTKDPISSSSYLPVASLANTLRGIGDTALAPVRYLFNGQIVCIEKKMDDSYGIGHIPSYDKEGKSVACRKLVSRLQPGEKSCWKTAVAIIFLIPGIFIALLTKLPTYLCAETKKYNLLAQQHFTPTNIILGQQKPFTSCTAIWQAILDSNLLNQPVEALIIHGTSFKIEEQHEKDRLFESLPSNIADLNPKKVIFIDMDFLICHSLFSETSQIQKYLKLRSKWDLCVTARSLDEALKAKTDKPCYYVLNSERSAAV